MNESWFRVRLRSLPKPVVVVDVSAAAAGLWPVLRSTLEGLAEALPETAWPDVAFLGGSARTPLAEFRRRADDLHAANAGRGRVISPLLDSFGEAWPGRVVVLATCPVVDLADWAVTPFTGRLTVVRTDPSGSVSGGAFPEVVLTDVDAVAGPLAVPPAAVQIAVHGGIPVRWDHPAYRFDGGGLVTDPGAGGDVLVGFLSATESPSVVAEYVRPGAASDRLPVLAAEPPDDRPWQPVTAGELALLDAWRGGRAAYCSACGTDHPSGVVACPSGAWALPTLARFTPGEFVRVRVKMFQATAQSSGPVVRIGDAAVVVRGPTPTVWRFDPGVGEWAATGEPWAPFERVGADDEFALLLPAVPPRGGI